jgi:hypothetical protein
VIAGLCRCAPPCEAAADASCAQEDEIVNQLNTTKPAAMARIGSNLAKK